jgi:hypothetical protein
VNLAIGERRVRHSRYNRNIRTSAVKLSQIASREPEIGSKKTNPND